MKHKSISNTKNIFHLKQIAEVISGVFLKPSPTGGIAYLQAKDILMTSPENSASRIDYAPKLDNYMLKKGDLLFAGKGSTYLCEVFDLDVFAVPSTTLYAIRLWSDIVSPQYLRWYMNHPKVVAKILASRVGSGTPMIHKPTLENLEIIIPDKNTQQRIVELSELQKKEERLLKAIAEKRVLVTKQILMNEIKK
jgi:restriction endonuclease S subunit